MVVSIVYTLASTSILTISISIHIISKLLLVYIIQLNQTPSKIIASTEIRPITVYDEAKYQIYNSIINV
mgnify:CR=1 FL=1